MSVALLRQFIREQIELSQAIVKKDKDNDTVVRKLVKFKKNSTQFHVGDNVDATINPETGYLDIDGIESWKPDLDGKF